MKPGAISFVEWCYNQVLFLTRHVEQVGRLLCRFF